MPESDDGSRGIHEGTLDKMVLSNAPILAQFKSSDKKLCKVIKNSMQDPNRVPFIFSFCEDDVQMIVDSVRFE